MSISLRCLGIRGFKCVFLLERRIRGHFEYEWPFIRHGFSILLKSSYKIYCVVSYLGGGGGAVPSNLLSSCKCNPLVFRALVIGL